jgi:hypothetical protein
MIRFDGYTATTRAANPHQLVDLLAEVTGEDHTSKQGRGFHTFGHRISLAGSDGAEVGAVQRASGHRRP